MTFTLSLTVSAARREAEEREALAAAAGRVASLRAKFSKGAADAAPAPAPQFNRRLVNKGNRTFSTC